MSTKGETSLEIHRAEMIRLLEDQLQEALESIEWGRPIAFTTEMLLEVLDRVVLKRSQHQKNRSLPLHPVELNPDENSCWRCWDEEF